MDANKLSNYYVLCDFDVCSKHKFELQKYF